MPSAASLLVESTCPKARTAPPVVEAAAEPATRTDPVGGVVTRERDALTGTPMNVPGCVDRELGRGRSGVVYRGVDSDGRVIARKVFAAHGVAKLVQYALLGAPNPYIWNKAAIRAAMLRRCILAELVEFWFGSKLRVARVLDHSWNPEFSAFEMCCELVSGHHVALHHPYTPPNDTQLKDALRGIMKPLQTRLIEAGFDGLVWQAGRGNPVALNNFMCEGPDGDGGYRWAWIDLESGVPALIPINPLDLLLFYLPKSLHHRTALFDDVDTDKLNGYLYANRWELEKRLGGIRFARLNDNVAALAQSQHEWKSLARHRRSISYRRATGAITEEQARWYADRPLRWYCREAFRGMRSLRRRIGACVTALVATVAALQVKRVLKKCWAAICSQEYRARVAKDYVAGRITCWRQRGQLSDHHAAALREQLHSEEASAYLADFGIHLAVKPIVKAAQWWAFPALWMAGAVSDVFLAVGLVAAGPCVRTLYTIVRLVQNALAGREMPWIALGTGALPVVGNLAYPLQIIATGANSQATIARFILYDTFSRLGQWIPVWGGADTHTEHLLNRLPDIIAHLRPTSVDNEVTVQPPLAQRSSGIVECMQPAYRAGQA
ncbi:MAG: hypothetical protein ACE5HE_03540 [Phycisphaerae bacterium]